MIWVAAGAAAAAILIGGTVLLATDFVLRLIQRLVN